MYFYCIGVKIKWQLSTLIIIAILSRLSLFVLIIRNITQYNVGSQL